MKNNFIKGALIAIIAAGSLQSCDKAIDIEPIGVITTDSALRTEGDFLALLNSTYTVLAANEYYGGRWQILNELMADHVTQGELSGDYLGIYRRSVDIFNGTVSGFYKQPWFAIARANAVLENIDRISGANRNRVEGEARFIRALTHFDLVRLWGQPYIPNNPNNQLGIPIKTTSVPGAVTRATVGEVYNFVITDLKAVENLLIDENGVYPTKWAAKALLARIYFQMNDFTNAYNYADQVIESGNFTFDTDHTERFSREGTGEAVFRLIYETSNPSGRFSSIRDAFASNRGSLPALRVSQTLFDKATSPADKRREWYTTKSGTNLSTKYDSTVFELPVLHLTEMKFIRAESAAELNKNLDVAIEDINDIINRAYGPSSPLLLPSTANAVQIKAAVRRERELEMIFEGDRLQQLKRIGAKGEPITIRNAPWNCNGLIFIFPSNEVGLNPGFVQNPTGGCQ